VLEITETTAMCNAETSLTVLNKLSDLGVSISIDDFGTGYSSLLYLKRLPANELKIDRGFITELAQDNDDEAIIQAIIALGKTLDMRIVAEGVETAEQQALLTQLGCNTLQGYLLARPAPPEALLEKIAHMTQRTESALVT
jgi:EAL domain-containing protein (putative c-di-GMP-specific phosphodiesterase class I)